jgi:hypothetical protein
MNSLMLMSAQQPVLFFKLPRQGNPGTKKKLGERFIDISSVWLLRN